MKLQNKILLIITFIIISFSKSYSYDLVAIDSLNLLTNGRKLDLTTIQVFYKNRKLIKKVKVAYFNKFIDKFLTSDNDYLISFVDKNKFKYFFSKTEFDDRIITLPPFLVINNKFEGKLGDTLKIQYETKQEFDFAELDKEFGLVIQEKIYLQMKYSKENNLKKYFNPITLIFPQDKTTIRWKENIVKIIIYEIK